MQSKKTKVVLSLAAISGLVFAAYGLINDPFSIPFQDYDQLAKEVQLSYENKSRLMKKIQHFGFGVFIISLSSLIFMSLFKKKSSK